jgi:hypothetical protein
MSTPLKFITTFSQERGYGWTETHYRLSSSDTPNMRDQLETFIANIAAKRALFLGGDCFVEGVRVSYPRGNTVAAFSLASRIQGDIGFFGTAPSVSLAVQMKDSTYTKSKTVHIRGFWDTVENSGVYTPAAPDGPAFALRLAQWKDALILGGYGWLSKDATISAKGVATGYVVGMDGHVTFTLAGPGLPIGAVGTQQQVRFSKFNNGSSVLNNSILCNVVTQTSLTSVTQHAAVPQTSQGKYNFRGTSFISYFFMGNVVLGERRMGKPLNRYPGRSRARKTA